MKINRFAICSMKNKTKVQKVILRSAIVIVCLALVGCVVWAIMGLFVKTTRVDWTMHGTWITAAGEPGETVEFSVKGKVKDYSEKDDTLNLDIAFPDSFPYRDNTRDFTDISMIWRYWDVPYFACRGYSYDVQANAGTIRCYALSLEEEYMIFCWPDSDRLMVASTDPETDPQEIMEYFKVFLEMYVHDE